MPRPPRQPPTGVVTRALRDLTDGVANAEQRLWQIVYPWCVHRAEQFLRRDRVRSELHPSDLVHEAYRKLTGGNLPACKDRLHFYRIASRAMRQTLADVARRLAVAERAHRTTAQRLAATGVGAWSVEERLDLENALVDLARREPRQAQALELRHFGGLEVQDIATLLGISRGTASRDLAEAMAWLAQRLARDRHANGAPE